MAEYHKLTKEIMFLDDFTCVYCGKRSQDLTIDHYIPQSLGGPDTIQNLLACCGSCNSKKNNRAPYSINMFPHYGRFAFVEGYYKVYYGKAMQDAVDKAFAEFNPKKVKVKQQWWNNGFVAALLFAATFLVLVFSLFYSYALDNGVMIGVSWVALIIYLVLMYATSGTLFSEETTKTNQ